MKRLIALLIGLVTLTAFSALAEDVSEALCGSWQDPYYGRAVLEIRRDGDGYDMTITWGNSADSNGVWSMRGALEGNALSYTDGRMAIETYDEAGNLVDEEVLYEDAAGAFTLTDEGILLWEDSREDRASEFAFEKLQPTDGQRRFATMTGLDALQGRLEDGLEIQRAYYTDGYGFSDSSFATEDPEVIEDLWEALNRIEVVGPSDQEITDWYPQILFDLSDGTSFGIRFDAHWLEIDGRENYELDGDEDFWSLTAALVEMYGSVE